MKTLLAALLVAAAPAWAAWTPPANPDPRAILNEARKDRMEQRYEDALAKHVWFHREAAGINTQMIPVRLSFALGDWGLLAAKYPPALEALKKVRDEAAERVRAEKQLIPSFYEMAAINRELDDPVSTHELFKLVESRDHAYARKVYPAAEAALVELGDYRAAGRFMDSAGSFESAKNIYIRMMRGDPKADAEAEARYRAVFARSVGTTLALLVKNGRKVEAAQLAARAREFNDAQDVEAVIKAALEGEIPPPSQTREERQKLKEMMP